MKSLAVLSLLLISTLAAQPGAADKAAALKESIAKNQAALKQYSWVETTEISLKGEVKKSEQKQCRYGPDGKVQKTEMPGAQPQQAPPQQEQGRGRRRGGGIVKKEIVEHKVEDLKEYMQKTAALLHEYAPPDHAKIQAAQQAGHITVKPGEGGVTSFVITDYAKPGDQLSLEFDTAAKKLKSYNVASYLDKKDDAVTLSVNFASLPDGVNHVAGTLLNVKAKNIQVRTTNANYQKAAQ